MQHEAERRVINRNPPLSNDKSRHIVPALCFVTQSGHELDKFESGECPAFTHLSRAHSPQLSDRRRRFQFLIGEAPGLTVPFSFLVRGDEAIGSK